VKLGSEIVTGRKISDYTWSQMDLLASSIPARSRILNGIIEFFARVALYIVHPRNQGGALALEYSARGVASLRLFTEDEQKIFEDAVFWIQKRELSVRTGIGMPLMIFSEVSYQRRSTTEIQRLKLGTSAPRSRWGLLRLVQIIPMVLRSLWGCHEPKGSGSAIIGCFRSSRHPRHRWDHGVLEGMKVQHRI
jgi:hypothetical protein